MTESQFEPPDHVDNSLWLLVRRYARPHALRYVLAAIGTLIAQIPQRLPALVIGVALDAILLQDTPYALPLLPDGWIPETTTGQVQFTIGLLVAAYVLDGTMTWLAGRLEGTARLQTLHEIRVDAFDAVVGHERSFFDRHQTGDVMSVLNNDVSNMNRFGSNAYEGIRLSAQILVAFAFMLTIHVPLAALLALMPLLLIGLCQWYTTRVGPRYERVRESVGRVNSRLEDSIEGIATVKAFAREDAERDRLESASRSYLDRNWSVIRLRLVFSLASWVIVSGAFIGLFSLGAYLVLEGTPAWFGGSLTAGALLTFLMYSQSFYAPIRQLMLDVLDSYEDALASSKRITSVLEGDHPDRNEGRELTVLEGRLEYEDVSFTYEGADEETLTDVSFAAEPGSLVGVVGPTGAGKSTLTKLLFRFYEPDRGAIRIDGTDISDVSRRSLREHLGYVSQDPFLFYGTVRENIVYGVREFDTRADAPEIDHADVVAAAKLAGAHEFITDLEDGYDTQVGERGASLSGGQRQRIAIARALLKDPDVLVLDEATSHVDNETERQIQRSIDATAGEQTTIAIAHRLSTVRNADQILVVDDGEIVERGTHDELVEQDGLYADLWRVQVGDLEAVSEAFLERARARFGESAQRRVTEEIETTEEVSR
ncbi:ABC transporter ATP-binding protein [Natronolimnobius baerhuensis]|uniref:ABC transporter n=1 Tax=Natronolimnobius baerhuensis TaxID=253108 RepID=A0A202E9G1_9EURY|nr:ABC transporter ATP-binding protein [Natronolimnobius baerhuensis]OVE84905.1 ABC transporter [Natronolimnobius baerhuensis]